MRAWVRSTSCRVVCRVMSSGLEELRARMRTQTYSLAGKYGVGSEDTKGKAEKVEARPVESVFDATWTRAQASARRLRGARGTGEAQKDGTERGEARRG